MRAFNCPCLIRGVTQGPLHFCREGSNAKALVTLLKFSAAMFIVPTVAMFVFYQVLVDAMFNVKSAADRMMCACTSRTLSMRDPRVSHTDPLHPIEIQVRWNRWDPLRAARGDLLFGVCLQ